MKRNVIEKFQHLAQIQQVYGEQIKALAETQLEIDQKILKEFELDRDWEYRDLIEYDFLKISNDGDGSVDLWEYGRCGDSDSCLTSISVHPLIISGNLEGYEQVRRNSLMSKANERVQAKQQENDKRRERLEKELTRITTELANIGK